MASGPGELRLLRRLLSSLLAKLAKKEEPPIVEAPPEEQETGELGYEPYIEIMRDEEANMTLIVYVICACETQTRALGDGFFDCPHCDKVCKIEECDPCKRLEKFSYDLEYEQEEEEDGDADL